MNHLGILLIDDSEEAHVIFNLFLKGMPCEVVSAYSADEGLAFITHSHSALDKSQPFSLIFLDQMMPGKDGVQAAREIRDWERTQGASRIRIIALTGLSEPDEQARALDAGCDEVWVKPITKEKLRSFVAAF